MLLKKYVLLLSPNYDWYATKQERVLLLMLVLSWKLFPDVLLYILIVWLHIYLARSWRPKYGIKISAYPNFII